MRHMNHLRAASPMPRGLRAVLAQRDTAKDPADLAAAFDKFKEKHDARYAEIEAELDKYAGIIAGSKINGGVGDLAPDREYSNAFKAHMRRGNRAEDATRDLTEANATGDRHAIQASMSSSGDMTQGGYLAPIEWDRRVSKFLLDKSPMRRLARVVVTNVAGYSTNWNSGSWRSGWVGETASRPETSTPQIAKIEFAAGELYANPAITQQLLDDAAFDLEQWVGSELADVFDRQEGIAFLSGNGVNKPFGVLQYAPGGAAETRHPGGPLTVVASGHASSIPNADALIDFKYSLPAPYRQNASWLMNSTTAAAISKMKDQSGAYLWREGLAEGQATLLLGRPVEIDENMPSIGAAENGVAKLPIAFGDFNRGYVINDRLGIRILRDPYSNKPFVTFYATRRVGGGVDDPRAIRLMKIAAN